MGLQIVKSWTRLSEQPPPLFLLLHQWLSRGKLLCPPQLGFNSQNFEEDPSSCQEKKCTDLRYLPSKQPGLKTKFERWLCRVDTVTDKFHRLLYKYNLRFLDWPPLNGFLLTQIFWIRCWAKSCCPNLIFVCFLGVAANIPKCYIHTQSFKKLLVSFLDYT